tara:strand:- start:6516 stop:7358 length:843 start_codon:yes stop_codon:yes gene_type:complete
MLTEIKKDTDLEEKLVSRSGSVDYVSNNSYDLNTIDSACRKFKAFYEFVINLEPFPESVADVNQAKMKLVDFLDLTEVLSEEEMHLFIDHISIYENSQIEDSGLFLTMLMHNYFESGKSYLMLKSENFQRVTALCGELERYRDHRIKLTVESEVGEGFGQSAKYVDFELKDDIGVGSFACAKYCTATIIGFVPGEVGWGARNCEFTIYEDGTFAVPDEARDCTYILEGDLASSFKIKNKIQNCVFKTSKYNNIDILIGAVSKSNRLLSKENANEVIYIDN